MKTRISVIILLSLFFSSCVKQVQSDIAVGAYYGPYNAYSNGNVGYGPGVSYVTRVNDNMVNITVNIPGILNNIYFSDVLIDNLSSGHVVNAVQQNDTLNGSFGSDIFAWHIIHNDTVISFNGKKQ